MNFNNVECSTKFDLGICDIFGFLYWHFFLKKNPKKRSQELGIVNIKSVSFISLSVWEEDDWVQVCKFEVIHNRLVKRDSCMEILDNKKTFPSEIIFRLTL